MYSGDELFDTIEELLKALRRAVKEKDKKSNLDGNMMQKFARYYYRYQDMDQLYKLLEQTPEKRGKKYIANWKAIRETLKKNDHKLKDLDSAKVAYVLGWVAKRARA